MPCTATVACGSDALSPFAKDTFGAVAVPTAPDTLTESEALPGSGQEVIAAALALALDDALGDVVAVPDPVPEHAASPSTTAGTRAIGSRRRRFTGP
ncbi:hypothetical protein GCM10009769_02030 [Curtobacterium luteum]|uniref:Uncharacterized protein n=1 Tax=Curtobacterium luteum TaxID=33881 RepID=A0A8H9G8R8_9MICO|nr:hypothetical protein GCM10009769_02030 [Curtobacterium luteum]